MSKRAAHFTFDGRTLVATEQRATVVLTVDDWQEIGVAVTHEGSAEYCIVINPGFQNVRVPSNAPVFRDLLEHFCMLDGFKWQPLASPNTAEVPSRPYSVCWRRPAVSSPFLDAGVS